MSSPADPLSDLTAAAQSVGMTPRDAAIRVANGVCAAYAAYNNGSNRTPGLPGYKWFQPIFLYETWPGVLQPCALLAQPSAASAPLVRAGDRMAGQPAAYAHRPGDPPPPCTGRPPLGTPSAGKQLFGFTATAEDESHNILVLRGTVTLEETSYDLFGWGNNTDCLLPSDGSPQKVYGQVNACLYNLYTAGGSDSLAASCLKAIRETSQRAPGRCWVLGGHSLGGAMLSLVALEGTVCKLLSQSTLAITFGSLHVGVESFCQAYKASGPPSLRIANLCDFVPSMVSLEPVIPTEPYKHVGIEGTFVWQTWDDWANHSLATRYLPMVQSYWDVIQFGARHYPQ